MFGIQFVDDFGAIDAGIIGQGFRERFQCAGKFAHSVLLQTGQKISVRIQLFGQLDFDGASTEQ